MRDLLPKIQSNDGQFHNGNPGTGEQGTRVTDTWLNNVQEHIRDFGEELKHLLKQAELEPNPAKKTQIYDAISQIIDNKRRTASTTEVGEVQLDSSTDSDAEDKAATPKAVKKVSELAKGKQDPATTLSGYGITDFKIESASGDANDYKTDGNYYFLSGSNLPEQGAWHIEVISGGVATAVRQIARKAGNSEVKERYFNGTKWSNWEKTGSDGVPVGAVVAFPKGFNPVGFLKANGSPFNQNTYKELYVAQGNNNVTPNLMRSDVGQLAYFAVDAIPEGWIEFDSIRSVVNRNNYPDLFQHLTTKYGSISRVPQAEDRFIRNNGGDLRVGQTQDSRFEHFHGVGRIIANNDAGLIIGEWQDQNHRSIIVHGQDAYVDMRNVNGDTESGGSRPLRTAKENPQSEVRPKSIIFKLCIKAKNTFEDVVFWIKAFGEVQNAGALDASRLAQELQEKAGINHTHRASDIVDLDSAIASAFTREKRGDSEIRKLPDGTMVQIARVRISDNKVSTKQYFTWPVAFTEKPRVFPVIVSDDGNLDDATVIVGIVDRDSTNTRCFFITRETGAVLQPGLSIEFLAFGRWK